MRKEIITLLEKFLERHGYKHNYRVYYTPNSKLRIECSHKELRNVMFKDIKNSWKFKFNKIGKNIIDVQTNE